MTINVHCATKYISNFISCVTHHNNNMNIICCVCVCVGETIVLWRHEMEQKQNEKGNKSRQTHIMQLQC
jgi:hypothetical protein